MQIWFVSRSGTLMVSRFRGKAVRGNRSQWVRVGGLRAPHPTALTVYRGQETACLPEQLPHAFWVTDPSRSGENEVARTPLHLARKRGGGLCEVLVSRAVQRQLPGPAAHQQQKARGCSLQWAAKPLATCRGKRQLWRSQAFPDQLPPNVKSW